MKLTINLTDRGFERIEFKDRTGCECSLQQSSAIGDVPNAMGRPGASFVWLGCDAGGRMHLDRDMVIALCYRLENWLHTGLFEAVEATP